VSGAGIHQFTRLWSSTAQTRCALGTGSRAAKRSNLARTAAGLALSNNSARQALRSCPITAAAARPWPTQSPTTNAIRPSSKSTMCTSHRRLVGASGCLIPHREPVRSCAGPRIACCSRQSGLALLVNLVHPLQTLAESAGQHGEQCLVSRVNGRRSARSIQTTSTPSGCCSAMPAVPDLSSWGEEIALTQRAELVSCIGWQVRPLRGSPTRRPPVCRMRFGWPNRWLET